MNIRPGTPADAEAVASLIAGFQPLLTLDPTGAGADVYLASVSAEAEQEYLQSSRYEYLLAEEEGELAGFIAMRDRTHLFHLFVASPHQRKGVARALWHAARECALRTGDVQAFTVNSSLNAMPVYRSFGFQPAGEVVHRHGIAFQPMRLAASNDT